MILGNCCYIYSKYRSTDSNNKNRALTWLTTLPLTNDEYCLTKQVCWDLICIRYGWQLPRVPIFGECAVKFFFHRALLRKKEELISIRQNNIWYVIFWKKYVEEFIRNQRSNHWRKARRKHSFNDVWKLLWC